MPHDDNATQKPDAADGVQRPSEPPRDAGTDSGSASLRDGTPGTTADPGPKHMSSENSSTTGSADQPSTPPSAAPDIPSSPSDQCTEPRNTPRNDPQTTPSDEQIRALLEGDPDQWRQAVHWLSRRRRDTDQPRRCYYILQSSFDPEHGYIPVAITENEAGYHPMTGQGEAAAPWYWGRDLTTALRICDDANTRLGHTATDVRQIILSSLAAQRS